MKNSVKSLLVLLVISGFALADDANILRCRGIAEGSARLACYDALSVAPATGQAKTTTPSVSTPGASSVLSSASPTTAAIAAAPAKADRFGLEDRAAPERPDVIESYIAGRFEGWEAKSNIKLANGQVWQIADDSSRYLTMNDPKVRIRRGALGAFYLEFEKSNISPRVRRVQ